MRGIQMETLIAYAFHQAADRTRAAAGKARVEAYYDDLWQQQANHEGSDADTIGLHVWDRVERNSLWPSWCESGGLRVASLHTPLGYQRIVGDLPLSGAPARLAQSVRRSPARFLELAPPFTMAVLDTAQERLELFTDSIGVGRLFQLRLSDGWVWSNRPVAALLFAGVAARAAARGWSFTAACGWFMDDSTPYDSVLAVRGATHIMADGRTRRRTVSRTETTSIWSTDRLGPETVEETAEALKDVARSVGRLWPGRPTVDLSGGRDSRVVAAAFLSAGVDLRLNSYDAVPGELQVAETLVRALPFAVDHVITGRATPAQQNKLDLAKQQPASPAQLPALVERTLRWHRYAEGLRPASYLFHAPPGTLAGVDHLAIGGAGGEVARGHFYPADVVQLDALPVEPKLQAFSNRLRDRLTAARSFPTAQAKADVTFQIDRVLRDAVHGGIENAGMFDYFYLVEQLRRGGTTGERSGVISPLLIPAFVRAAFAMDTSERLGSTLHRELVRRLVPEWAELAFFRSHREPVTPTPQQTPPQTVALPAVKVRRLADAPDRDLIEELVLGTEVEGFDPQVARTLWASSVSGVSTAAGEAALSHALWRGAFTNHLADINRHLPDRAKPRQITHQPDPSQATIHSAGHHAAPPPVASHLRRIARHPAVRRVAASPLWKTFRGTRLGQSWRSISRRD